MTGWSRKGLHPVVPRDIQPGQGLDADRRGGTEYIDFFSGAGTLNYGPNNPVLKEKLLDYVRADGVVHGLDMATSAKKAFLETVDRVLLKPRNWQYTLQFTGPTGTNAVEAALKIARQVRAAPMWFHSRMAFTA